MKRIDIENGLVTVVWRDGTYPNEIPSASFEVDDSVEVFPHYISNGDGTFTAPEKASATEEEVKAEAGSRINKLFPGYKQMNYIARQSELDRIETGTMRDNNGNLIAARTLTAEETAELVAIKGVWDWILSVRIASAVIEAAPPKTDALETDSRWPDNPS